MAGIAHDVVIIGGGPAGFEVASTLREINYGGSIHIIGEEKVFPYNRIRIAEIITGNIKEESELFLKPTDWYRKNNIGFTGQEAVGINTKGQIISLDNSTEINYRDVVVFATGSKPVFLPIKGTELENVFYFRKLEDACKIRSKAKNAKVCVIVGGGLLGLEAASAMKKLVKQVHVIHLADRLMESQLDKIAAFLLKEQVEKQGINVHLSNEVIEFIGDGVLEAVELSAGEIIPADIAVMAVGKKPQIEPAKASGIKTNIGIIVDAEMRTNVKNVYAAGECAEYEGTIPQLLAPSIAMARVAAKSIAGISATYVDKPVAAQLKIADIPLVVGGKSVAEPLTSIVKFDYPSRIYQKLNIEEGGISGVILLGDTRPASQVAHAMTNCDAGNNFSSLILGSPGPNMALSLPNEAVICQCYGITKGEILHSIREHGLSSVKDVGNCTKAGTGCKGCKPVIENILKDELNGQFETDEQTSFPCGCLNFTRSELGSKAKDLNLRSVESILETLGNGSGCSICKPALQFIVSRIWLTEYKDDRSVRFINDRVHANIQKDGSFSVVPRIYGGVITPSELKRIAQVSEKFEVPLIKITGGQRIDLFGVAKEDLPLIWEELGLPSGHAYTKAVRTCKTCVGELYCRYGLQDSLNLGVKLEKRLKGLACPGKVKLGVSGCPRNCAESYVKDIGLIGTENGWQIFVGGNGGAILREANFLASVAEETEALRLIDRFLQHYRENAEYGERTSQFIERTGIEEIRNIVLSSRQDGLEARLADDIEKYCDPWEERNNQATPLQFTQLGS